LGLGTLAGIPAVVFGHIALKRIWRSGGALNGRGIAVAGIVTGYTGIFCAVIVAPMFMPGALRARELSRRVACLGNLKHIMFAIKVYSPDYGECFPTSAPRGKEISVQTHYRDLGILYPTYMTSLDCFTCPASGDRMPRGRAGYHLYLRGIAEIPDAHKPFLDEEARQVSYAYSYNGADGKNLVWTEAGPSTTKILADRHASRELTRRSNHKMEGRNVAFQDGHVKWISGSERLLTDPENPDPKVNKQSWWSERPDRPAKK
jgi:prepilin-type processing-associated H-X9-DG protein